MPKPRSKNPGPPTGTTSRISETLVEQIDNVWHDILDRFADGESLKAICEGYGFSRSALFAYRRIRGESASREFNEARRDSADAAIDDMVETISNTGLDAARARNKLNALMWIAEKRNPDDYAQRSRQDINVTKVDLNQIISDANARLLAYTNAPLSHSTNARLHDATPAIEGEIVK